MPKFSIHGICNMNFGIATFFWLKIAIYLNKGQLSFQYVEIAITWAKKTTQNKNPKHLKVCCSWYQLRTDFVELCKQPYRKKIHTIMELCNLEGKGMLKNYVLKQNLTTFRLEIKPTNLTVCLINYWNKSLEVWKIFCVLVSTK